MKFKTVLKILGLAVAGVLIAIQFVPYGRNHTNPPVTAEPNWDIPQTRQLAQRACFDCHSNETIWPWYTNIAPISWIAQYDVDAGRAVLNFSEWDAFLKKPYIRTMISSTIDQTVYGNSMPPYYYIFVHPDAALTMAEEDMLLLGLKASAHK